MVRLKHLTPVLLITAVILSQPKISVDKEVLNLGDIYSGLKKKGTLLIKNIGKDTLKITSIHSSCGCTAVKKPKDILLPKQSDEIEIEFNSSGYNEGPVTKYVYINSNDPTSPLVTIKVVVNVKEELTSLIKQRVLTFENIQPGSTVVKEMKFKNPTNKTIKIIDYKISSPAISIKLDKKTILPNDTLTIEVTVSPEKEGYWTERVILETDSKNQPKTEFQVVYVCVNQR